MAKKPQNQGKAWTAAEIRELKQLVKQNTPTKSIARKLGRSMESLYNKASTEAISLKPTNQSPNNRKKR
ncbi:MAG: SANT/Myb domain-containing protein [Phycisphaerales bacterium]|nr:SANT/Myb domain-containing protein [Phycisphaerales bacterium]